MRKQVGESTEGCRAGGCVSLLPVDVGVREVLALVGVEVLLDGAEHDARVDGEQADVGRVLALVAARLQQQRHGAQHQHDA